MITKEQIKDTLPKSLKGSVDDGLINRINHVLTHHPAANELRDNIIGYIHVMQEGKFKVTDYMNAVMYVSFKLMGDSNISAYSKVFPDKIKDWNTRGLLAKDVASMVSAYNKNKLVNLIYEQTVIPSWVLNQDLYQKAINAQAALMMTARSEKVRSDAANSLMTHLKRPEAKVQMEINLPQSSVIDELEQATRALVEQQKKMLELGGMTLKQVAHSRIIDVTPSKVSN
jgi:hypothetical protein